MPTVTIQISDTEAQALKRRTGKRTIGSAVVTAIDNIVKGALPPENERALQAFKKLRVAARKAPIRAMRPPEVDAIIEKVRADYVRKGIG